ncbi:TetR/AcrR family transcriptional regulator [Sneathiella sp.]|jgi:AcrR family transcriptional regulator|uniref:TetR/AcrR family transcriptional regulator n=1 Tax=Sneathiella sp. TaxID=1964365 RepID=UPI0039E5F1D4
MTRATQKRTLQTRARLVAAAEEIIKEDGFEALRVEQVVLRAGTAKGTFFSHFKDKDTLMDLIIGARIDGYLDDLQAMAPPQNVEEFVEAVIPLCEFMTCERYVFDVILRYSGAAGIAEIGPIAATFERSIHVFAGWFERSGFRRDVSSVLLAEGVQAFATQAMALRFCARHGDQPLRQQLEVYMRAWLLPPAVPLHQQ